MNGPDFACWTLIVAASAASLVPLIRQIPYVQRKMLEGVKPWVCDLCMSFWSTLLFALVWSTQGSPRVSAIPAFAIAFLIVRKNGDPTGPSPSLTDLKDMEDGQEF